MNAEVDASDGAKLSVCCKVLSVVRSGMVAHNLSVAELAELIKHQAHRPAHNGRIF